VSPGCAEAFNLRGAERKCTNCTEDAFTLRRGVSLRCSATALMRSLSILKKGRFLDAADLPRIVWRRRRSSISTIGGDKFARDKVH
jgi:hypothetical protein